MEKITLQQRANMQAIYIAQKDLLSDVLIQLSKDSDEAAYPITYIASGGGINSTLCLLIYHALESWSMISKGI